MSSYEKIFQFWASETKYPDGASSGEKKDIRKRGKKYRVQNRDLYYNRLLVPRSKAHIEEYCKCAHEGTCMHAAMVILLLLTLCCYFRSSQSTGYAPSSQIQLLLKFMKRCQHSSAKQVSHFAWSVSLIN